LIADKKKRSIRSGLKQEEADEGKSNSKDPKISSLSQLNNLGWKKLRSMD